MKPPLIVTAIVVGCGIGAIGVQAMPPFKDVVVKTYKPEPAAAKAISCATCHVSNSDFGRNVYGKQLEKELGDKDDLTAAMVDKVGKLDADGDGVSNEDEIKAGTKPADPKSAPATKSPVAQQSPTTQK